MYYKHNHIFSIELPFYTLAHFHSYVKKGSFNMYLNEIRSSYE